MESNFSTGRAWPKGAETLEQALEDRSRALTRWLHEHAPECTSAQAHLNEGSSERGYWHHGYLTALRDVMSWLQTRSASRWPNNPDGS
jgi:hypothetical protein